MGYEKGDAEVVVRNKRTYDWSPCRDENGRIRYRDKDGNKLEPIVTDNPREEWKISIELPHSCDEWDIGGPDEARLMIKELQRAIQKYYQIQEGIIDE